MTRLLRLSFKTLNLQVCKFLDIHLMWTVSSSAHSNNFKLTEPQKPTKLDLLKPQI